MKEKNIKKFKNILKNNSGITLIALVITIIVMLILVGVTINMAVNGGLFGYAGNAAHDTELAKQEEQKIAEGRLEVDGKYYKTLDDYLEGKTSEKFSQIYTETREYKEIINGVETVTAWIPKGFAVGTCEGINKVADGLVIQDDKGNQFVWIPVNFNATGEPDEHGLYPGFLSVFYRTKWSSNARTTGLSTSYTEPYVSGYEGEDTEYYAMMKSVQDHKGFYIGRYEAGSEDSRTSSSSATTPIVKKGVYPYNYVKWGESMTNVGTTGAVALSKSMYNDSTKYGVVSTLCYGVQWDAMLDFVKDTNHNVTSSLNWGNYYDHEFSYTGRYSKNGSSWNDNNGTKPNNTSYLLQTGASEENKAKNIYDLAGNYWEWTMEAYSASDRVSRGGSCSSSGSSYPASRRDGGVSPTFSYNNSSFRPTLYIR